MFSYADGGEIIMPLLKSCPLDLKNPPSPCPKNLKKPQRRSERLADCGHEVTTLSARPKSTLKKTPTPEQWQAHAGVIVNDALGILKMLSVPLFIFGLYRIAREGTITAGLAHVVPWPILETITHEENRE